MRDINRQTHICEMKAIAQPNQRQSNNMMPNQLLEILPWLLQLQTQHNGLLRPVARLQQIIYLEKPLVRAVGEALKHCIGIEVPHRSPRHNEESQRAKDGEVEGCVYLFHEPVLFGARANPKVKRYGPDEALHEKLTSEGEYNYIKAHESKVGAAFAIVPWCGRVKADGNGD